MPDPEPSTAENSPPARWIALGGLALLCGVLVALFSPILEAPLFSDDQFSIKQVGQMEHWTETMQPDVFTLFRPVKNLFFYVMVHGNATLKSFHLVTLFAYLLATVGVFTLAQRMLGHPLWGLAVAAIWALSASNVSIAVWASCFNISIAIASMTFGLWAWDKWRETPGRPIMAVACFTLFAIALCSYETAITLAPIAVLIDLFRGRRIFSKGSMVRYSGIAVLVISYLLIRGSQGANLTKVGNPSFTTDIQNWQIMASAPYFLWTHFLMWLAPWGRLECLGSYLWDRSIPAIILPFCWIFLIGVASLCVRFWKAGNLLVFGLAWFFIASLPSNNFVPLGNTPYADYYVPIPAIGLALAAAALIRSLIRLTSSDSHRDAASKRVAWVLILLMVGGRVANLTAFQGWVEAWKSPALIMAHTVAARPHQYLAKTSLASMLADQGNHELAEDYATRAIQDTEELAQPFITLGQIRYEQGRFDEAAEFFLTAVNKRHLTQFSLPTCHLYLGRIIGRDPKRTDEAFTHFVEVLKRQSLKDHFQAVLDTAAMYDNANLQDDRAKTLRRGLEIYPDNDQLLRELKDAEAKLVESEEAP